MQIRYPFFLLFFFQKQLCLQFFQTYTGSGTQFSYCGIVIYIIFINSFILVQCIFLFFSFSLNVGFLYHGWTSLKNSDKCAFWRNTDFQFTWKYGRKLSLHANITKLICPSLLLIAGFRWLFHIWLQIMVSDWRYHTVHTAFGQHLQHMQREDNVSKTRHSLRIFSCYFLLWWLISTCFLVGRKDEKKYW